MQTYRDLFRAREFSSLFVALSVRNAAETMTGLALATLIYGRTGSPLLSALAMFGSSFAQVVGAMTLLSIADRVAARAALTVTGLILALITGGLGVPGFPVWLLLSIELAGGLVSAASGGVVWGLVNETVPNGTYVLGRSAFNASVGVMQIAGFATGGALLHFMSARGALWVAGVLYVASAALVRFGLTARPPRATGRASIRETWAGNVRLLSSPARRCVYVALWVPNGLIVGCEAIFVAYARNSAAALFVAAGAGMLVGDIAVGRLVPPRMRASLISPLRLLLATPYLLLMMSRRWPWRCCPLPSLHSATARGCCFRSD
ncbi:MAG: MFS transporter [Solirubrobacteraceae bacterium]